MFRTVNNVWKSLLIRGLCLVAAMLCAYPVAWAGEEPAGEYSVVLDRAVLKVRGDRPAAADELCPIRLDFTSDGGVFSKVWGYSELFNKADHRGKITEAQATPDTLTLKIDLAISGDPWVHGGQGVYTVELRRLPEGRLAGTYRGSFTGKTGEAEVTGQATGVILPLRPKPAASFVPVVSGEHPRLLFRKTDLAALKAKAGTPVGKVFYDRVKAAAGSSGGKEGEAQSAAICCGVMYQLTGERKYADRAREIIGTASPNTGLVKTGYHNGANGLPEPWGWNISTIALTWDLCYDGWEPQYRDAIAGHLTMMADRMILRPNTICQKMNWNPGSNYQPGTRGGASIAAFALWGEKGPAPAEPRDPGATPPVIASGNFTPPEGMPANALESGMSPTRWLSTGALTWVISESALDAVGGVAAPKVTSGTKVEQDAQWVAFQPLNTDGGIPVQELYIPKGKPPTGHETSLYVTAVKNDKARCMKVGIGRPGARVWLSGQELGEESYLGLEPGAFPLVVYLRDSTPWGTIKPTFTDVTEAEAAAAMARKQREYRAAHRQWEDASAEWKATGGMDPHKVYLKELAELHMERYFKAMMGEGGYQGEGESYTVWSTPLALQSAHCYKTAFGRNPSPLHDVEMFSPRYVAQTVFTPKGSVGQSFGNGQATIGGGHYARLYQLVPDDMKPGVLWAWNHYLGVAADADEPGEFAGASAPGGLDAVFGFVSYPADPQPRNPSEGGIPRVFVSQGRGNYIFRNQWKDGDDIVAQIHLRSLPPVGWNQPNAGSLRIRGLGYNWAASDLQPKNGERAYENVVLLPDDPTNPHFGAFATCFEARKDGSGAVTADLDGVYAGIKRRQEPVLDKEGKATGETRERPSPESANGQWIKDNLIDLGIRGTRSFAADYSGASGAPAMFVLVDDIKGGKTKLWTWQIPEKADAAVEGNTFTLKQGDATLQATFIAPADVRITRETGTRKVRVVISSTYMTFGEKTIKVNAIQATGGADKTAGDFFVVMTLQKGEAPEVRVEGKGLAAKVAVGGQTVRFDGRKIVFGR